jgi:hypothetical protein
MLKKLLYLYNDGHNPFPNMKGQGFGFVPDPNHPDRMDLQYYADDDMTQEEADRLNGVLPELEEEAGREHIAEIEELYPERFIPTVPTKQEYDFEKYKEEYEDQYPMEDYDDELENINDKIKEIKNEITQNTKGDLIETYSDKLKLLDEEEKAEKKKIIIIRIQQQKISDNFPKLTHIADVEFLMGIKNLTEKQRDRILELFEDIMQDFNTNSKPNDENHDIKLILKGVKKIVTVTKQPEIRILRRLLDQGMEALNMPFIKLDETLIQFLKKYTTTLMKIGFPDEMKTLSELGRKELEAKERIDEIKEDIKYMTERKSYIDTKNEEIKLLQQQYGERKKILAHKKRLAEIKELYKTDPEQAAKDALELNAELKEKESLKQSQQLSKSAQKKANAAAKKAAAEKQVEKQAEASVVNAQETLKSTGTYGKKLEDFFSGGGQPILQKFTGDKSKIHDIEKQEIIPNETVTFDDKTENSLRKACTLDLYNDKFVFEIKNYVNNSIKDDVIPMQPSKFAGTKYFVPTYFEDGRLYSLNLKYDSPKTGIKHRQNILPDTNGREVVFVIRLKEGLYQYKPFLDKKNNILIPNGETSSDGRPLYFFEYTNLKPCLDYKKNPAFNLKGHLTPI